MMLGNVFHDKRTKLLVISLALLNLLVLPLFIEDLKSLSWSWATAWQPLFIFSNAATSYYMYSSGRWRWPGFFLMLLTAFSVEMYQVLHYVFSGLFFLSCLRPILQDRRLWGYAAPYSLALPLFCWDVMLAEFVAVAVLLGYHSHLLWLVWRINRERAKR
jgi:hypothetical protein